MIRKKHVGDRLYDFLSGSIGEAERVAIENHLTGCRQCSEERIKVERAFRMLNAEKIEAPDLGGSYWEHYWKALEPRLTKSLSPSSRVKELLEIWKDRQPTKIFSPKLAYGIVGFALGAVLTLGILTPYLGRKNQPEVTQTTVGQDGNQNSGTESASLNSFVEEISGPLLRFFQKAKTFLIAMKNFDESKEPAKDFTAKLETSKKLVEECRSLKRLPLDPREQQLLSELDVVLVQLSKVQDEKDSLKFNLVKEGIEKNNLLMRIRVHELAQEVRLMQVSQSGQNRTESF